MLRLGLLDPNWQVLNWTIDHPTLPGAYAWGEAINPRQGGLELGDMPHSWAAAEYISLVRDMVLTEDGGALVVNGGTPESWLDASKHVILQGAPTHFGRVSVSLTRLDSPGDGSQPDLRVELAGDPPEGWRVRLPGSPTTVLVDDTPTPVAVDHRVQVPSGMHDLLVRYAPPTTAAQRGHGIEAS
jgi:hypothetical protein